MKLTYDVIIVGGGVVGASLALALSASKLRILVIDAKPAEAAQQVKDGRTLALSLSSQRIFSALNIWPQLANAVTPIQRIIISDQGHFGRTILSAKEEKVAALGYVTPMSAIQAQLQIALNTQNIQILQPAFVHAIHTHEDHAIVQIQDHKPIMAKLVVIADGGVNPQLRDSLGVSASVQDYQQTAIVSQITTSLPHHHVAYERFTREGPLALLPLSYNTMAMIWTVATERSQTLLTLDETAFLNALHRSFGDSLGRFTALQKRHSFPLRLIQTDTQVMPRVVLMGNAKHTLHPVAGQGFNLALRGVASFAEVIADAVFNQEDIGLTSVLARYHAKRQTDEKYTIGFTHGLIQLFSNDLFPLTTLRGLGLALVDRLPIKSWLARRAMGLRTPTTRLAANIAPTLWKENDV